MTKTEMVCGIAENVAKQHIYYRVDKFEFNPLKEDIFSILIEFNGKTYIETCNIKGMPDHIWSEYIHCRLHEMAARIIRKLYPIK